MYVYIKNNNSDELLATMNFILFPSVKCQDCSLLQQERN